ncbi:unnamed protein product, partial [Phaeothamnion confervicola]
MSSRVVALVRHLPKSFVECVTIGKGAPKAPIDLGLAKAQHSAYVEALRRLVDDLYVLPADESYPDCVFIEDTMVFCRGTFLLTRPGHPSREGETAGVREVLLGGQLGRNLRLQAVLGGADARLDGGDVLFTGRHLFVGLTTRTNEGGAAALQIAVGASVPVHTVEMRDLPEVLHLKCLVTLLRPGLLTYAADDDGETVIGRMADHVGSGAYKAIGLEDREMANVVSIYGSGGWRGTLIQGGRCERSVGVLRGAF